MKTVYMDFYHKADKEQYKDKDVILVKPHNFKEEDDTEEVRQYLIDVAIYSCISRGEIDKDEEINIICLN